MKKLILTSILTTLSLSSFANLDQQIKDYTQSESVRKTINKLEKIVRKSSWGLCAKHVRLGFMDSGLIPAHPGISYAKNYTPYFNQKDWTNLFDTKISKSWNMKISDDLYTAPNGCAIVYDAVDSRNDRNGHIGHIETRIKKVILKSKKHSLKSGFISDYYSTRPRTGLKCKKTGKTYKKLKTFTSRPSGSPHYKANTKVSRYINVTSCLEYSSKGAISNAWKNRKVIGVHCKLQK